MSIRLRLCEETAQRVSSFYLPALYMSSVADFLVNGHELHQESFHYHQDVLDEEDDGRQSAPTPESRSERPVVARKRPYGDRREVCGEPGRSPWARV